MSVEQQAANFPAGKSFGEQIAEGEKIPKGLAHFLSVDEQMGGMKPMFHKALPGELHTRAFALSDFILMMGEHQVFASQMEIEGGSKQLHAHRAALDVP